MFVGVWSMAFLKDSMLSIAGIFGGVYTWLICGFVLIPPKENATQPYIYMDVQVLKYIRIENAL